jgi:hypothetical protein
LKTSCPFGGTCFDQVALSPGVTIVIPYFSNLRGESFSRIINVVRLVVAKFDHKPHPLFATQKFPRGTYRSFGGGKHRRGDKTKAFDWYRVEKRSRAGYDRKWAKRFVICIADDDGDVYTLHGHPRSVLLMIGT